MDTACRANNAILSAARRSIGGNELLPADDDEEMHVTEPGASFVGPPDGRASRSRYLNDLLSQVMSPLRFVGDDGVPQSVPVNLGQLWDLDYVQTVRSRRFV